MPGPHPAGASYRFRETWAVGAYCKRCCRLHSQMYQSVDNEEENMNYTYLVKCADGTLYCGWTNHLEQRVKAHNTGKGAKYTKSRRPVTLVYYETFETRKEAMKREAEMKQLSRQEKWELIKKRPICSTISAK